MSKLSKIRRALTDLRNCGVDPTGFEISADVMAEIENEAIVLSGVAHVVKNDDSLVEVGHLTKIWPQTLMGLPIKVKQEKIA